MTDANHYQILEVSQNATQVEIKQAYRRLVKQFHPDTQRETANHETMIRLNAAYEVLSDPQRRQTYDRQCIPNYPSARRQQRTSEAQSHYQRRRQVEKNIEIWVSDWIKDIYKPINPLIASILNSLEEQIDELAADPFDDELMAVFQDYLGDCRTLLQQAKQIFASQPNPAPMAKVAASLYYCLNQVGDGIDELEWFSLNYDDHHLHTGQELFRIAQGWFQEAQEFIELTHI
ncbi:J domain-containing protein [Aphanothece sacrum]|uniref:Molecular chaperone DnaJ n=1 Tax=Aphanothece sacrum FPU1 TaxID=1920663 RepID=A0A401IM60_APHSA|nr:J domain-containing protein [Aphanothece sacrum]GBF82350.1 molecular chaperone DnaJ [Aphanothece sacrum FPU1]GBF84250.1 molecular chaperone DnaJ [Aphanothece sacrum FPU3]